MNAQRLEDYGSLLDEVMIPVITDMKLYNFFINSAIKSSQRGQNAVEWARLAEAIVKNHLIDVPDERIFSDTFILTLAMALSNHFKNHVN